MPVSDANLIVLVVGLLVGGLAIHLGATFALRSRNYVHAVVTAAMGAVAWWLLDLALTDLGVTSGAVGSLLGLVVWVGVLKHRYECGWIRGGLIGVFAWLSALAVLAVLSAVGVGGLDAYGVPI